MTTPPPAPPPPGPQSPASSSDDTEPVGQIPDRLVVVVIGYLAALVVLAWAYFRFPQMGTWLPSSFGPIPIAIPWWGAVGAVIGSLYGIFFHNRTWKASYNIWHYTRPLVGAVMGSVGYLAYLLLVSVAIAGGQPAVTAGSGSVGYYLAAFVVGNSDALFNQLIQKVSGLLFSSKDS